MAMQTAITFYPTKAAAEALVARVQADEEDGWTYTAVELVRGWVVVIRDETGARVGQL